MDRCERLAAKLIPNCRRAQCGGAMFVTMVHDIVCLSCVLVRGEKVNRKKKEMDNLIAELDKSMLLVLFLSEQENLMAVMFFSLAVHALNDQLEKSYSNVQRLVVGIQSLRCQSAFRQ